MGTTTKGRNPLWQVLSYSVSLRMFDSVPLNLKSWLILGVRTCNTRHRAWKDILGIRDLTKIRCGNREKDKYLDGTRDLTKIRCGNREKDKYLDGIRDLTKIRCGNREKDKYLEGNRDLTAPREAGLTKIWAWDAGFFRLLVRNSRNRHDPNKRSSSQSRWCILSSQTIECAWLIVM